MIPYLNTDAANPLVWKGIVVGDLEQGEVIEGMMSNSAQPSLTGLALVNSTMLVRVLVLLRSHLQIHNSLLE